MARPLKVWCFSAQNFGDALTPIILRAHGFDVDVVEREAEADLFGIGSILRRVPHNASARIWTSGMIAPNAGPALRFGPEIKILALRGTLSRDRITGIVDTVPLGDGGLLIGRVFTDPVPLATAQIGLVPHMQDRKSRVIREAQQDSRFRIINVFDKVEAVVNAIRSCTVVLSSSLHGLITADSFGIPNAALAFVDSGKTAEDTGKFADYGSAFGRLIQPTPVQDIAGLSALANTCRDGIGQADPERLSRTISALRETLQAI